MKQNLWVQRLNMFQAIFQILKRVFQKKQCGLFHLILILNNLKQIELHYRDIWDRVFF